MRFDTRQQVHKAITEKEHELTELKKILETIPALSKEQELAVAMHAKLCTWNHTDGCSWLYETKNHQHDWTGWAHKEYLKKAQKVIAGTKGMTNEQRLAVITLL